jgi:broad specificity phosphatase PhoE
MTNQKIVFLIRHGETESNITKSMQGPDEPLNALGRSQAERLGIRLARSPEHYPITAILSSDFIRARETAELISLALPGVPVAESWLFRECLHPSRIRGLSVDDPEVVRTLALFAKHFHDDRFSYEDGETFNDRKERALAALAALAEYPSDCIALVTHGVFATHMINCILHGRALTSEMLIRAPMMFQNTGIVKLTYGDYHTFDGLRRGWRLHPGDTSHLD